MESLGNALNSLDIGDAAGLSMNMPKMKSHKSFKDEEPADPTGEPEGPRTIERTNFVEITKNSEGEEVLNGFLTLKEEVGRGAFCKVKRAVGTFEEEDGTKETQVLGMKVYNKNNLKKQVVSYYDENGAIQMKTALDQVLHSEIRIWEKFDHDYIVKIFELFDDYESQHMYLIMQYSDLGQIAYWDDQLKRFKRNEKVVERAFDVAEMKYFSPEQELSRQELAAKHLFRQVAEAVDHMHNKMHVANRDIKLDNLLFLTDLDRVKLTDFTTAVEIPQGGSEPFLVKGREGTLLFESPESVQR